MDVRALKQRRFARIEATVLERVRGLERVLDLGCGEGRLTVQLQAREVIGLDKAREPLERAKARGVTSVLGDAHALPFASASFDAVVATDAAFVVLDYERACREAARVLRPGGLLIAHLPTDRIFSLRSPFALTPVPQGNPLKSGANLLRHANAAGLASLETRLFRWSRAYPYLVRVPSWPRLRIWSHGLFVLERRA